jgi:hypothetical protein
VPSRSTSEQPLLSESIRLAEASTAEARPVMINPKPSGDRANVSLSVSRMPSRGSEVQAWVKDTESTLFGL